MRTAEPNSKHSQESRLVCVFDKISKLSSEEMALLRKMLVDQTPVPPWNQISREFLCYAKIGFDTLTPRELQVLREITKGKSNKVAARELQISPRTIEIHRSRVMQKLGARNVVELCNLYSAINHKEQSQN